MIDVLNRLPFWGKAAIVLGAALLLGLVGYIVYNGVAGVAAGIMAACAAALGLWRDDPSLSDQAASLATRDRERAERDAADARAEAAADARARGADRAVAAAFAAESAGADDDGDPNRVLDRHSAGPGISRSRATDDSDP